MSWRRAPPVAPQGSTFEELLAYPNTKPIVNVDHSAWAKAEDTESFRGTFNYAKNRLKKAKSFVQDDWAKLKEAIKTKNKKRVNKIIANGDEDDLLLQTHHEKMGEVTALKYAIDKLGENHPIVELLENLTEAAQA